MKVLHVCSGYQNIHKNVVNSENKNNINCKIFIYTTRHKNSYKILENNVDYYNNTIKLLRTPFFFRTRINNVSKYFVSKYLNNFNYEIIHAHMMFSDGDLAYRAYIKFKIPYIVAVRNTDINSWFYWIIPWNRKRGFEILKNAKRIIFLSCAYKNKLFTMLPIEISNLIQNKTEVIPNGIEDYWHENEFIPKKLLSNNLNIITVGSINKNKNQLYVLNAIDILVSLGFCVNYHVVGKCENTKVVATLKKSKHVIMHDFCPKEELIKLYRTADIFVMPSIHETFGLVYAEAMSQGLPVVYSLGQGFDGHFKPGEVGYGVNCKSVEDICDKLLKIIKDYENISARCIVASRKFNWDLIAKKYISIYEDILNNHDEK